MAQNIKLKDRVRYFPTKTKADILPRLGCNFVGTVIFNGQLGSDQEIQLPSEFGDWQDVGYLNYKQIVGERDILGSGTGLISNIDFGIWDAGTQLAFITVMGKDYDIFYGQNTAPITDKHSGFMFYDVYNVTPNQLITAATSNKVTAFVSVDIYESTEFINDAQSYDEIN
jgi:hypothetical protein